MKSRFTTVDIIGIIVELRQWLLGYRVINVYDIDNKTYLFKLAKTGENGKAVLLIESGIRIHTTDFEWPKNMAPSGFSMKMRKHIRNRRLEKIDQLGVDRILDLQFGSGECAYHVIVELYDRGNLFLTDHEYTIMHLLRPRTDADQDVKYATHERYPVDLVLQREKTLRGGAESGEEGEWRTKLRGFLEAAKSGDQLRRVLTPHFAYGPSLLEHCLLEAGLSPNAKVGRDLEISPSLVETLSGVFQAAETIIDNMASGDTKGIITYKLDERVDPDQIIGGSQTQGAAVASSENNEETHMKSYLEYHPLIFAQCRSKDYQEFETFNKTVDEFFSKLESQKTQMKTAQQEKAALKKLENIRKDHEKRVIDLQSTQEVDKKRAQLIEMNQTGVDSVILLINHAIANQVDWEEIDHLVENARDEGDPIVSLISKLKLDINHIALRLSDPYHATESDDEDVVLPTLEVDIDLGLTAFANAKKFYDMKRSAALKEHKTISSSAKALKSAEVKTRQMLKDVQTVARINKVRKTMWFEKFHWFVSSENFLVVAGRDSQQNELLVKRYFRPGDVYVHADIHGASTVIVKNHLRGDAKEDLGSGMGVPPPKTLTEAGQMAVVFSSAWQARVVTAAWWVHHDQVSKSAPTGEYLTSGSFMIRGKKNYLPPCHLIYGFGFLFKLDEDSVERHKGERRVRGLEEEPVQEKEEEVVEEVSTGPDSDSDLETDFAFPNTKLNIDLATIEKPRSRVNSSAVEPDPRSPHLTGSGEFKPEFTNQISMTSSGSASSTSKRLSAKTRREMKKQEKNQGQEKDDNLEGEGTDSPLKDKDKLEEAGSENQVEGIAQSKEVKENKKEKPLTTRNERPDSGQPCGNQQQGGPAKRGQKSKLKKMKEKYKDQDDEEREYRMSILQSDGPAKETFKKSKKKGGNKHMIGGPKDAKPRPNSAPYKDTRKVTGLEPTELVPIRENETGDNATRETNPQKDADPKEVKTEVPEENDDDELGPGGPGFHPDELLDQLNSLTGCPGEEDALLYAVPVCAPYTTLLPYKFKVKLTPGNTKRGKAVKAALASFLGDRTCSPREKDLLRILKDQDLSRNFPGKVKVSGANMGKNKSGKK